MKRSCTQAALAAVSVFAMVLASPSVYGKPPQPRAASERASSSEVVPPTAATIDGSARSKTKQEVKSRAKKPRATATTSSSAKPVSRPDLLAVAAPAKKGKGAKPKAKKKSGEAAKGTGVAPKGQRETNKKPKRRSSRGGGNKVSIEDEFLIEGKLEKPSAYYILRRSQGDYDWARLDAKFLPLVLESVQDPLF